MYDPNNSTTTQQQLREVFHATRTQRTFFRLDKDLLRICGNANTALLLAFLIDQEAYLHSRAYIDLDQDWFPVAGEFVEEQLGLKRRTREGAEKNLEELGLVESARMGLPAKKHYRINYEQLQHLCQEDAKQQLKASREKHLKQREQDAEKAQQVSPKQTDNTVQNVHQCMHEKDSTVCTKCTNNINKNYIENYIENLDKCNAEASQGFLPLKVDKHEPEKKARARASGAEAQAVELVQYLADVSGKRFSSDPDRGGKKNLQYARHLLKQGYSLEDAKLMICWKVYDMAHTDIWGNCEPVTVFQRHGARYIEQAKTASATNQKFIAAISGAANIFAVPKQLGEHLRDTKLRDLSTTTTTHNRRLHPAHGGATEKAATTLAKLMR